MNTPGLVTFSILFGTLNPGLVCRAGDCNWTPKTVMPTARMGLSTSVVNGKIYAIGGAASLTGTYYPTVEEYDPMTDTWTRKANMPTARVGLAGAVVNDRVYVSGGGPRNETSLPTLEEYDPATDTWSPKSDMPTPRTFHSACAVDGKMYVLAGSNWVVPDAEWDVSALDVYDPATDTWATEGVIPTPRSGAGICVVDGRILLVGGAVGSLHNPPVSTLEEYDPVTGAWTRKADMPTARMFLSASVLNGKAYAAGGGVWNGAILPVVEMYDPITDTWTKKPDMRRGKYLLSTCALNGKIYAIGGTEQWYPAPGTSIVEEYDPTPAVALSLEGRRLSLSWRGVLQSSRTLSGSDWEDVSPVPTCPWSFPGRQEWMFYRAREF